MFFRDEDTILGAAKEVTGPCILIETGRSKFLLDCGQRQGHGTESSPGLQFNPREIDFIILSHAHISFPQKARELFEDISEK